LSIERTYICRVCQSKNVAPNKAGRLPTICAECSPRRAKNAAREKKRKATKRAGERRKASAADMHNAERLAVGLAIHNDLDAAARWAGIDPDVSPVEFFHGLAKKHHKQVIAGDVDDLSKRMLTMMNYLLFTVAQNIDEMAPRDRVNGVRQLASARELLVGNQERAQFAQISLSVIGADGKPVSINGDE